MSSRRTKPLDINQKQKFKVVRDEHSSGGEKSSPVHFTLPKDKNESNNNQTNHDKEISSSITATEDKNLNQKRDSSDTRIKAMKANYSSKSIPGNSDVGLNAIKHEDPCTMNYLEVNDLKNEKTLESSQIENMSDEKDKSDVPKNKKNETWILKKKLLKAEKKQQREEEYRKNLIAPKGQKIKLIDPDTFEKIKEKSVSSFGGFVPSADEFPQLTPLRSSSKSTIKLESDCSAVNNEEKHICSNVNTNVYSKPETNKTSVHSVKDKYAKYERHVLSATKNRTSGFIKKGKPPKKRDPIQIDILQCMKVVKTKDVTSDIRKKFNVLDSKSRRREEESNICGNQLDSSNPVRSRGKKREHPKGKRHTRLKLVILKERELHRKLRELGETDGLLTAQNPSVSQEKQVNESSFDEEETNSVDINTTPEVKASDLEESRTPFSDTGLESVSTYCLKSERESDKSVILKSTSDYMNCSSTQGEIVSEKCSGSLPDAESNDIIGGSYTEADCSENLSITKYVETTTGIEQSKIQSLDETLEDTRKQLANMKVEVSSGAKYSDNEQISPIHSRKFREYCNHMITAEINQSVSALIQDIVKFHDRLYERDPVKANARRRHVTGFREVLKYLKLKKLKLVIIAPDLEKIQSKGGINDMVAQIKEEAAVLGVPYVFALNRRTLGRLTIKKVPVSCIGILSYDGTEKNFHSLMDALPLAQAQYQKKVDDMNLHLKGDSALVIDVNREVVESFLTKLTSDDSTLPKDEDSTLSQ